MSTRLRALVLAVTLTVAPVTVGVLVSDTEEPAAAPPPYTGTPLADVDTTTIAVARAPFCDRIVGDAVTAALPSPTGSDTGSDTGSAPAADSWTNGDELRVDGRRDVVHEYGCRFAAAPARAEAWVFAPPVTRERARQLARRAVAGSCRRVTDAASYGAPSVAAFCPGKQPSITFQGLFGDAWLTCRLTAADGPTEQDLLDRAGRWCVAVARAATA